MSLKQFYNNSSRIENEIAMVKRWWHSNKRDDEWSNKRLWWWFCDPISKNNTLKKKRSKNSLWYRSESFSEKKEKFRIVKNQQFKIRISMFENKCSTLQSFRIQRTKLFYIDQISMFSKKFRRNPLEENKFLYWSCKIKLFWINLRDDFNHRDEFHS